MQNTGGEFEQVRGKPSHLVAGVALQFKSRGLTTLLCYKTRPQGDSWIEHKLLHQSGPCARGCRACILLFSRQFGALVSHGSTPRTRSLGAQGGWAPCAATRADCQVPKPPSTVISRAPIKTELLGEKAPSPGSRPLGDAVKLGTGHCLHPFHLLRNL